MTEKDYKEFYRIDIHYLNKLARVNSEEASYLFTKYISNKNKEIKE